MMRNAFLAILFTVGYCLDAPAQGLTDCGCDDIREMRDRWCSARAAKAEYRRIADHFNRQKEKTGETQLYTVGIKVQINQKCVQEAINAVSDRGVVKGSAVTNENFLTESALHGFDPEQECRVEVTSKNHTACLKQIVESHEGVHRQACQNRRLNLPRRYVELLRDLNVFRAVGSVAVDTKYTMTAAEFADEEANSYEMEMALLAAKWKELQERCISAAFESEVADAGHVGERVWNRGLVRDPSGQERHVYKMYDLTADPCPYRPRPAPADSECKLR
jgi:hypothetical protein